MNIPEGWKTTTIGAILTDKQIAEVRQILHEPDYLKRIGALKTFTNSIKEQLDGKGLDPAFTAYLLEFNRQHFE